MKRGIKALITLGSVIILAACATRLSVTGNRGTESELSNIVQIPPINPGPTTQAIDYPVLYGTNRIPIYAAGATGGEASTEYGSARDLTLHYGRVWVTIPKHHQIKPEESWWSDFKKGANPRLTISRVEPAQSEQEFVGWAANAIASSAGSNDDYIVVYIHGYNDSFKDAAESAAQLGADLGIPPNRMFMFSWPARGELADYTFDEATVDASEQFLREFFMELSKKVAPGKKIHVVAHSMGNRALLRVVDALLHGYDKEKIHFGQIVLAAADVDREVFANMGQEFAQVADRTTVYLSPYDFAVGASQFFHQYPRVGCGTRPQVDISGIDSVVSMLDNDFPGHGYIEDALPVLTDLQSLFVAGTPKRPVGDVWKVYPGPTGNSEYWVVTAKPSWIPRIRACVTENTLVVSPTSISLSEWK
ncbi:alpha/beta hydrolase [Paraburkholderia phenazinium]|uniref:Esterase/lipase superfamily enzyme n=1 Tax=Paraburkholderia phenazinium TaxID=60549 RepID=A0A1G7W8V1_9BURK|nr:alpha/beta fold hydrolase [Paraburkholderia phenazinium]SDG68425.1 Esterase/lipase superfamily enzyme [Paraburkholderia phenazinium]